MRASLPTVVLISAILCLVSVSICQGADDWDGQHLLNDCRALKSEMTAKDAYERGRCVGLIYGVLDTLAVLETNKKRKTLCAKGVSFRQAVMVVEKYLDDHPEKLHWSGASLVLAAMWTAFPCAGDEGNETE